MTQFLPFVLPSRTRPNWTCILSLFVSLSVCLLSLFLFTQSTSAQSNQNSLLVLELETSRVLRFNGDTGQFIDVLIPTSKGGIEFPQDMEIGFDGNIYVSNLLLGTVSRYDRDTGDFLGNFIPQGRGGLSNPDDLVFHTDGNLYVSDRFSARILRYNGTTGDFLGELVNDGALGGFVAYTFGPDGNVYASMFNGSTQCLRRYNGQTGAFIDDFFCTVNSDSALSGVEFAADGTLFLSRYHAAEVLHISAQGNLIKRMRCDGDPRSDYLHIGPDGRLYVSNLGDTISVFDPQTGACLGKFLTGFAVNLPKGFAFLTTPSIEPTHLYLSSTSAGSVTSTHSSINFGDEDILRFDLASHQWQKYFDGSDVGLKESDIDAFILKDNLIYLSLRQAITLTSLGTVMPEDMLKFTPTSLGESTRGTFEWFLDGSDVGLNSSEELEGAAFAPDGRLLISTRVSFSVPKLGGGTLTGQDEDLIALNNPTFGATSAGQWSLYFDATDVRLDTSTEDIRAFGILNREIFFSTLGIFSVRGVSGDASDVVGCLPSALGIESACTFRLFFDGEAHGFGTESIDGVALGSLTTTVTSADAGDSDVDDLNEDESIDAEPQDNEWSEQIFLPWSAR